MGSPWPWSQEPVKASSGSSLAQIQTHNNNNNNNKRMNYGYDYSYYNHHNHDYHHHHHNAHSQPLHQNQRYLTSPSLPPVQQLISNDVGRLRSYPFYNHEVAPLTNNNVVSPRKPSAQSQFVNFVKELPTWNIYYSDQKHRIVDFTVDKLIHQQAGRNLREACKSLPRLGPGQAEMTLGFSIPAQSKTAAAVSYLLFSFFFGILLLANIIHTNGPLTEDAEQLTGCYVNSFNLLLMHRLRTIAFPCISAGKKGLSKKLAAEIALRTVRQFLEKHKQEVDRVIFCLHHQKDIEIYLRYMQIYFPVDE